MLLISFQFCICHMQTASWLLMGFPCMRALKATRPLLHMGASLNFLRAAFVVWKQSRAQLFHAEGQGQQANQQPANPTLNVLHSGRPYLKSKSLFAHLQGSPPCAASQPAGSTSQHYGGELLGRLQGCRSVEDCTSRCIRTCARHCSTADASSVCSADPAAYTAYNSSDHPKGSAASGCRAVPSGKRRITAMAMHICL